MLSLRLGISLWCIWLAAATENNTTGQPQDGRIVGGWETSIVHFPHQVSLQLGTRHVCGGAILSPTHILTAAHCVLEYSKPQYYAIRAGSSEWTTGGSYTRVLRIVPHPNFHQPTRMNNDIALIQLQQPLVYSSSIQPIVLATRQDQPSSQLFVSGWGSQAISQLQPEKRLRYTVVQQRDQAQCARNYFGAGTVTSSMFCAGTPQGGRDSCQGDSGGPLVISLNGRMRLYGIVSWGMGCAHAMFPGIYTRVAEYNDWIEQTMKELA
ncbi:trypsin 3A1 [Drosophila guanche]|uniref:Blast:Trypsin-4 n=1 Tax=Drosophila guanche TaxID=7266 RepID=A0A3B0IY56_DROGU|nr:trypsin 3A1 [Drosophila guanche]SPP72894.1 blast:Trypsin-4 [Drosophila guanche]